MIQFEQTLGDKEYRKVFFNHYFKYKIRYISPIVGYLALLLAIILNIAAIIHNGEFMTDSIVLIILGLLFIFSPYLAVRSWIKNMKSSKLYSETTNYQITDDDKIIVTVNDNSSTISIKDLHSYYNKGRFLMLYISKVQFYIFDKQVLSPSQIEYITSKLTNLGIKEQ